MTAQTRTDVFVSYSHDDADWLKKLQTHLKPYVRKGTINLWDDTKLRAGVKWKEELDRALASARVAVLLVSPNFLASDFIAQNELPPLLAAAAGEGVTIAWLPVSASAYEETDLKDYQALSSPTRPLDGQTPAEQNATLVSACKQIAKALAPAPTTTPAPAPKTPDPGAVRAGNEPDRADEGGGALPQIPEDLSGAQLGQLHAALLSAFRDRDELAQLMTFHLGESLDAIVGPGNLREVMFKTIQWAQAHGRLGEFIAAARKVNPGNPALRRFLESLAHPL